MKRKTSSGALNKDSHTVKKIWKTASTIPHPNSYWVGRRLESDLVPDNILIFPFDRHRRVNRLGSYHPRFVLDIVTGGEGTLRVGERDYYLKENNSVLIFPHQFNRPPQDLADQEETGWVVITFDLANSAAIESLRDKPRRLRRKEHLLVQELLASYKNNESSLHLSFTLARLLRSLCEAPTIPASQHNVKSPSSEKDELLSKISRYVFNHLDTVSPLAGLARELGLSSSQLRIQFHKLTETSLGAHIRKLRLTEAARLLQVTDVNITEISRKFGYSSVHAFSGTFKSVHGISPKQYQKRIRQNL